MSLKRPIFFQLGIRRFQQRRVLRYVNEAIECSRQHCVASVPLRQPQNLNLKTTTVIAVTGHIAHEQAPDRCWATGYGSEFLNSRLSRHLRIEEAPDGFGQG